MPTMLALISVLSLLSKTLFSLLVTQEVAVRPVHLNKMSTISYPCSNVRYDKRGEVQGVTYCTEGVEGWTPVKARRRVKRTIPHTLYAVEHLLLMLKLEMDSDSLSTSLTLPDHATVNFSIVDGKPGLQVITRNTRKTGPLLQHAQEPN